jgi:hypothetical protein
MHGGVINARCFACRFNLGLAGFSPSRDHLDRYACDGPVLGYVDLSEGTTRRSMQRADVMLRTRPMGHPQGFLSGKPAPLQPPLD